MSPQVTRFAPSPTGRLHLGHAFSGLYAWRYAQESGGRFLLRIEDIDHTRCREEFVEGILEDLAWLGLEWEEPVRRQSHHLEDYQKAMDRLDEMGLIYPCFCTRKEIGAEIAGSSRAPHGPEGPLYPGICRKLTAAERQERIETGLPHAFRLDVLAALEVTGPLTWTDLNAGTIPAAPGELGDVVLGRKDIGTSYHLAVTHDDALHGVSLVTRGEDLFHATHIHRLLQELLGWPEPKWRHHPLLTDESGQRLAKRDLSLTLQAMREDGIKPEEIRARFERWWEKGAGEGQVRGR